MEAEVLERLVQVLTMLLKQMWTLVAFLTRAAQ